MWTQLTHLSREDFENLCDGCGLCCSISKRKYACPSLDTETNRCKNYANRDKVESCVPLTPYNVPTLHALKILPDSCAYVRFAKGQKPLESPPEAELIPFELAPKKIRRRYEKARKKWLENATGARKGGMF